MSRNFFDSRNPKVTNLIKLGDYLGRSLRENVILFSAEGDEAVYLTESNKVVKGQVDFTQGVGLTNIIIEDAEVFSDNKTFEKVLTQKTNSFIQNIFEDNFIDAGDSFDNLLNLWENRVKFGSVADRLEEKCSKTKETSDILGTDKFSQLKEITPKMVDWLIEHKEQIQEIPEISNAIKLSNTVATAFDMAPITLDELAQKGSCHYRDTHSSTIYEMVCRQELLKQELLESKKNFSSLWATCEHFNSLVTQMFCEGDEYLEPLAETISEIPFMAFTTKKQIAETLQNAVTLQDVESSVSSKDVKIFASKIFEAKKPVRDYMTKMLNEKYGINLLNLKEVPSFRNLLNTQVVVFEALSRLSPKGSVQKQVLSEVATMLKSKEGVQSIDVNIYLKETFEDAGYNALYEGNSLMQYLDYNAVADDLGKIGEILRMLKQDVGGAAPPQPAMGQEGEMAGTPEVPPGIPTPAEEAPELGQELGEEDEIAADMEGMPGEDNAPAMDPEEAAAEADAEMNSEMDQMAGREEGNTEPEIDPETGETIDPAMAGEEGMEPGMEDEGEEIETAPEDLDQEEVLTDISEIEELINDLTAELEMAGGESGGEVDLDGDGDMEGGEEEGEEEELVDNEEAEEMGDVDNDGESDLPLKKKKKGKFPPKV